MLCRCERRRKDNAVADSYGQAAAGRWRSHQGKAAHEDRISCAGACKSRRVWWCRSSGIMSSLGAQKPVFLCSQVQACPRAVIASTCVGCHPQPGRICADVYGSPQQHCGHLPIGAGPFLSPSWVPTEEVHSANPSIIQSCDS